MRVCVALGQGWVVHCAPVPSVLEEVLIGVSWASTMSVREDHALHGTAITSRDGWFVVYGLRALKGGMSRGLALSRFDVSVRQGG